MVPHLQLVCYKEHRLVFGNTLDSFLEDMGTHASINSAERIIQEKYGPFTIEGTCQAHSLTLPSTQVGTSLSNLERGQNMSVCKDTFFFFLNHH